MQKTKPLATGLTFLFLALLLAALAVRFWASDKAYSYTGPTHIAAGEEHVYLFASGDIYRLTRAGELLSVTPPDVSGLSDDPIDLMVMPGGQLLIAEQRPAFIRLCDAESWICRPVAAAAGPLVKRQFKVLPVGTSGELLLTDARGDTLWNMDDSVAEPRKLIPDGTLAGPNGLIFDDGGHLWVADTDHRRILELLPADGGTYLPGRQHSAINALTVGKRFYPMMLERTGDGRIWVIQAAEFSEPHADLVIYDPEEGAQAMIELPEGAYPTDVAAVEDSALVTDIEQLTVYQVSGSTHDSVKFGDIQFQQRMQEIRQQRAYYDRLGTMSLIAIVLFGVLMIAGAFMATPGERRWTQPPAPFDFENAPSEVPASKGIHWLERDPKIQRLLKWLEPIAYTAFILMTVSFLVLYAWIRIQAGADASEELASNVNQLGIVLIVTVLLGALIMPFIHYSARVLERKLGTDGQRLYIRLSDGRELAVDPAQLSYTNRAILYRQYTFPLIGGSKKSLYAPGEVETWLAPLLHEAEKLTEFQAMKNQWRNRDSLIIWLLVLILGMGLMVATIKILGA